MSLEVIILLLLFIWKRGPRWFWYISRKMYCFDTSRTNIGLPIIGCPFISRYMMRLLYFLIGSNEWFYGPWFKVQKFDQGWMKKVFIPKTRRRYSKTHYYIHCTVFNLKRKRHFCWENVFTKKTLTSVFCYQWERKRKETWFLNQFLWSLQGKWIGLSV